MVEQKVDLTGGGQEMHTLTVLTDGEIVRVNTNLQDTRTGRQVIVVEVEANDEYGARTAPGGVWDTDVTTTFGGQRTDIRLTRQDLEG